MRDNATIYSPGIDGDKEPLEAPHLFLRRLTYIAAVSTACILIFTGFGLRTVVSYYVIRFAERSSVNISIALSLNERDSFFMKTPNGRKIVCEIPSDRFEAVDARIRQFLTPFDILKIKVYNRDACILYSTDHAIIGERDSDNIRLHKALSGSIDSKLVRKDRLENLANESGLDVDVVETYAPIYDDEEIIGCFELYMDVSRYRDEIRKIVSVGIIVIALIILVVYGIAFKSLRNSTRKLKEAQGLLALYAVTDPLTGLYNRRYLLARARQELSRVQRKSSQDGSHAGISVTLFDLDHFKKINDTYGHVVGDQVLKETARRILATSRPYDLVGRWGGEEFIIVHPDADHRQSLGIASRIRGAIRMEPYLIEGKKIHVTASFGVATVDPTAENDFTAAFERADRALYNAKDSGRDRVV